MDWRWDAVVAGCLALICGSVGATEAGGQVLHANGQLPQFEVATVRPWKPAASPPSGADGVAPRLPAKISPLGEGGQESARVHFIGQAALLIASAYNVPVGSQGRMIVGGPEWLQSEGDRYEVQAKIEDAAFAAMQKMPATEQREQVALMEQALLADRFALKVHFETLVMPLYALVVAKNGAKMADAKDGEVSRLAMTEKGQVRELQGVAVTVEQLVHSPLMVVDGRRVVDRTGLLRTYDFTLNWTPALVTEAGLEAGGSPPALFTAIEEQLGLRLVSIKEEVEVVVIDHVERPSGN